MVIGITLTGIALIGVFLMYLFQASARKHRIFYRLSYIFLSICAMIGILFNAVSQGHHVSKKGTGYA